MTEEGKIRENATLNTLAWMLRHTSCDQKARDENYVLANMWLEREGIEQVYVEEGGLPFHYPIEQVTRCPKCYRVMSDDRCEKCNVETVPYRKTT